MNTATYTLRANGPYAYAIKDGRKVLAKIVKVSDGWHDGCSIFDTVDGAVARFVEGRNQLIETLGGTTFVEVIAA